MAHKIKKEDLILSTDVYEKCQKTFDTVQKHFGIKIRVHADDEILEDGQIFLFNHFARFETAIPPYIFYTRMQKFTRTVTSHSLFNLNGKLDSFLCGGGGVPNDLPNLLPFLAAEALRGHKIVIFPEGSMIKDRRVMDDSGRYRIFSHSKNVHRKHHRGAAVLAFTLELFKRRIKDLFEKGDTKRLDHWCQALDIESHEELKKRVDQPTLMVPGTITFHPIRIGENILTKTINLFMKNAPEGFLEEMIIEGNILLRDTDMDVRFGKPIKLHPNWAWWEKLLLDAYFLSIKSLEEFFGLRERAETWKEKLLARIVFNETRRIRDQYMSGIYQGLTINIGHVASDLVLTYVDREQTEVSQKEFHKALYLALKKLQEDPDIHLHNSLDDPENYQHLQNGSGEEFEQFLRTAIKAKLIVKRKDTYVLQEKLTHKHAYDIIRRENPILVSANEAEPIHQIHTAVIEALQKVNEKHINMASELFDDELRAYSWAREEFQDPKYNEINKDEKFHKSGAPYLFLNPGNTKTGILLVHGFLSSPQELKEYGEHLHEQGFTVMGARLAGHGTSPCDLATQDWENWLDSVRRSYRILSEFVDEVIIIGFSTGGALSLLLAAEKPEKLKSVAAVCAPLQVQNKGMPFVPLLHKANKLIGILPRVDGIMNYKLGSTSQPEINYRNQPLRALRELSDLMEVVEKKLTDVECPILVLQSEEDEVVKPKSAQKIYDAIASPHKKLQWIKTDKHGIIYNNIGETWALLTNFVQDGVKTETPQKEEK